MGKNATIKGIKETRAKVGELAAKIGRVMALAITTSALRVVNDAKRKAPTDLGNIEKDIDWKFIEKTATIVRALVGIFAGSPSVLYAKYVEHGTHRHLAPVGEWGKRHGFDTEVMWVSGKAHPFIYPAYQKNYRWIQQMIVKAVAEEVRLANKKKA